MLDRKNEDIDYKVDIAFFDKEKPIGISGLMRIKNDAEFVSYCIDSCVNVLDELIIVYSDSIDNTYEIIVEKQRQYPDKIKIYYYKPWILSHNLSKEEFEEILKWPKNSIHLLSNYYNYTLSKATFRYAFKIDADQIYFSDKLKQICDLYRKEDIVSIKYIERISYIYYYCITRFLAIFPTLLNERTSKLFFSVKLIYLVQNYTLKKIQNEKVVVSFSGLNIFKDTEVCIPTGTFVNKVQPPINGSGDHIFFKITSEMFYEPLYERKYNRVIEVMKLKKHTYWGGFLWLHLNAMRKSNYSANLEIYKNKTVDITTFLTKNLFKIEKKMSFRISTFMRSIIYSYLLIEKTLLDSEIKKNKFIKYL